MKALNDAIRAAGSAANLGKMIDVSGDRVRMWKHRGSLPVKYVLAIERSTGVSRHDLRPDIYPKE